MKKNIRKAIWGSLIFLSVALTGCATTKEAALDMPVNDPYENINRKMFAFNMTLDKYALKYVAQQYAKLPDPIKTGVSNFFDNLSEPSNLVNNTLQGKYEDAFHSGFRFVFNSTFGIGGLVDWMTPLGMEEKREDFGQTMAHWGVAPGPYLMLPFLGPRTVRHTAQLPVEWGLSPLTYLLEDEFWVEAIIYSLDILDTRAELLPYDKQLELQLDPYVTIRDIYYSERRKAMYDGNVPEKEDEDKFDDEFDEDFFDE